MAFAQTHGGNLTFSVSSGSGGAEIVGLSYSRNDSSRIDMSSTNDRSATARAGVNTDGMAAANSDAGVAAMVSRMMRAIDSAVGDNGSVDEKKVQAGLEMMAEFAERSFGVQSIASTQETGGAGFGADASVGGGAPKGSRVSVKGSVGGNMKDARTESGDVKGRGSLELTHELAEKLASDVNSYAHDAQEARAMLREGLVSEAMPAIRKWAEGLAGQQELAAGHQAGELADGISNWQELREMKERFSDSMDEMWSALQNVAKAGNVARETDER